MDWMSTLSIEIEQISRAGRMAIVYDVNDKGKNGRGGIEANGSSMAL